MELKDIVKKLVGNINPVGDSSRDPERLENLKEMCELVQSLVSDIEYIAFSYPSAHEHSIKTARDYAFNFLYDLGMEYDQNQLGEKL